MTRRKICWIIFCFIVFLLPNAPCFGAANDRIVAIVNDEVITQADLSEFLSLIYMNLTAAKLSQNELNEAMAYYEANGLENLIDEKLKIYRADKIELKVRPEAVEKKIGEIKKQYATEAEFTKDLIARGMTLSDLRKKILDQYKAYYAEQVEVKQKVFVSPQQVNEYYEKNPDQFRVKEGVVLDSVFFPYENNNRFLMQQKANDALAVLKDPVKLSQYTNGLEGVAEKFSGIFAVNTIRRDESLPEIEKAVFSCKIGDVTPLVHIKEGIYIFKIKETLPEKTSSLTEAKDKIYNFLFQKQLQERRTEWIKKLKQDAFIEIR